jgi:hypothetical protein
VLRIKEITLSWFSFNLLFTSINPPY